MKHRLTVKIEKRFKKQLSERFNPRNATGFFSNIKEICVKCPLCEEYFNNNNGGCENCPFDIYGNRGQKGCLEWLNRVVGKNCHGIIFTEFSYVAWYKDYNEEAIELLKKLREQAKKYIIWVENTK